MKPRVFIFAALTAGLFQSPLFAQGAIPTAKAPDAFGVCIHFTTPQSGEMDMLSSAGFRWARTDLKWASTETSSGSYNFSAYDTLMSNLTAKNMKAVFILDYRNPLYDGNNSPYTAAGRTAFTNWVLAAVEHFKNKGVIWELYNEPNASLFWTPHIDVNAYIQLANTAGQAIKTNYPNETLVGPALASINGNSIDFPFLEACFQGGVLNTFDGITIHPYRTSNPETAEADYRTLRTLIKRYAPPGKSIPILSGEWGYNTATGGFSDTVQGRYLPRQWLMDVANDVPLSLWYDWRDDGTNPADAEHNFGVVENAYSAGSSPVYVAKSAYNTAKALNTALADYTFNKRIYTGSRNDYVLLFTNGSNIRLAAWTTGAAHAVNVPTGPGAFNVTNSVGVTSPTLSTTGATLALTLSNDVQYLAPTAANDILKIIAGWQRLPLDSIEASSGQLVTNLSISNPGTSQNLVVTSSGNSSVTIAPGLSANIPITLTMSSPTGGGNGWMDASILINYGSVTSLQVTQQTYGQMPFDATVLPLAGSVLPIQIFNYGGAAWSGTLTLGSPMGISPVTNPINVSFNAGEHVKTINISLSQPPSTDYSFSMALKNSSGTLLFGPPVKTYHVSDNFSGYTLNQSPSGYILDVGNNTVPSVQTLTVAAPPAGLPSAVSQVLKLHYEYPAASKFVGIVANTTATKAIPAHPTTGVNPKAVGLWIYGDGNGLRGGMRFRDSSGETFQVKFSTITERVSWLGWKYVTFPLDAANAGHWGGDNDGTIAAGPITLNQLYLHDNIDQVQVVGDIYIASPTYLY